MTGSLVATIRPSNHFTPAFYPGTLHWDKMPVVLLNDPISYGATGALRDRATL